VPMAEMNNYSTVLRSLTQGSGIFRKRFSHYEKVPDELAEQIVTRAREAKEQNS